MADGLAAPPKPRRTRAPERTRRDVLDAAIAEFSEKGFAGARVDEIAARTRTTKRMIYYYFGGKAQLYAAVLEELYGGIRDAEAALELDAFAPAEAIARLVEATFDYHAAHPEFVRLVATENIQEARHVAESRAIKERNAAVIDAIGTVLARGAAAGELRGDVDPFDLHMLISAFCFHRVANRHTLGAIFGHDLRAPPRVAAQRAMIVDAVLRYLAP